MAILVRFGRVGSEYRVERLYLEVLVTYVAVAKMDAELDVGGHIVRVFDEALQNVVEGHAKCVDGES